MDIHIHVGKTESEIQHTQYAKRKNKDTVTCFISM